MLLLILTFILISTLCIYHVLSGLSELSELSELSGLSGLS